MSLQNSPSMKVWGWPALVAMSVYVATSLLIAGYGDHLTPLKEVFYSWLLVFINAYIGIFIANRAIKADFTRFLIWSVWVNGIRAAIFLIALLAVVKVCVTNVHDFVLMTFIGYFAFIAVEVFGLNKQTLKMVRKRDTIDE